MCLTRGQLITSSKSPGDDSLILKNNAARTSTQYRKKFCNIVMLTFKKCKESFQAYLVHLEILHLISKHIKCFHESAREILISLFHLDTLHIKIRTDDCAITKCLNIPNVSYVPRFIFIKLAVT